MPAGRGMGAFRRKGGGTIVPASPPGTSDTGILTGALIRGPEYNAAWGDSPWDSRSTDQFETNSDHGLSIIHYGAPWRYQGSMQTFFTGPANLCYANGSYPFLDWSPWEVSPTTTYFSMTDIIAGTYDGYIDSYATAIAAWGKPVFLRPMWEMNGTWFTGWSPAAVGGPSAANFVSAWQHIYTRVKAIAPKTTFVWCPNIIDNQAGSVVYPLTGLYPGDAYVDWVGMDGYAWGSDNVNKSFTNTFQATYNAIYALASASKPLMIGEWGCDDSATVVGGSKSAWIADAFAVLKAASAMPRIRAIVWFNRTADGQNWRIENGSGASAAYAAGLASDAKFKGADYGAATVGPIPAPSV